MSTCSSRKPVDPARSAEDADEVENSKSSSHLGSSESHVQYCDDRGGKRVDNKPGWVVTQKSESGDVHVYRYPLNQKEQKHNATETIQLCRVGEEYTVTSVDGSITWVDDYVLWKRRAAAIEQMHPVANNKYAK